jgi:tRNA modification GTPase
MNSDTIAALSTPPGESGLAVVRMSGPRALDVLSRVLRTPSGRALEDEWEHRRLYHGGFFGREGERIDEVMAAVMRAPESYTGEDVVEITCHGGTAVVARILETLYAAGARPAQAGEFTRRAFLNGKLDLIQAEAVADLIHARTEIQRVAAERQLSGGLSRRIDALADEMLSFLGLVEANIDFIEEEIDLVDAPAARGLIARQLEEVQALLSSAAVSRPLRDGYRVVLAGPVNAGKSSVFNRLLGESRAIVTEIPGTTRDVLRETVVIDGVPFVLHDTAGLRASNADRVEAIGVGRATDAVQSADVVLFVLDSSSDAPLEAETVRALRNLDGTRSIVVENKIDLPPGNGAGAASATATRVRVSAKTGAGFEALRRAIVRLSGSGEIARVVRERAVLNARLVALMEEARSHLVELDGMVQRAEALELVAERARSVLSRYEEATGRRYHEGLLDVIFSRFCIGK